MVAIASRQKENSYFIIFSDGLKGTSDSIKTKGLYMENVKKLEKNIFIILGLSLSPIIPIFIICALHPDSALLLQVIESTKYIPAITSREHFNISKILALYCKTAPLAALLCIAINFKRINLKISDELNRKIIICVISAPILLFVKIWINIFCDLHLENGRKLLQIISRNEYFLLFYYFTNYAGVYCITFGCVAFILKIYPAYKKGRSNLPF